MSKYYLFLFFILAFISSCEKDDENLEQLIMGEWYQESALDGDTDKKYRTEFFFRQDGKFESSLMIISKSAGTTVGYLSVTTGNYRVVENKLYLSQIKHYGLNNQNEYLDRNKLELLYSQEGDGSEATISFADANSKLIIDFKPVACLALGICVTQQIYSRVS